MVYVHANLVYVVVVGALVVIVASFRSPTMNSYLKPYRLLVLTIICVDMYIFSLKLLFFPSSRQHQRYGGDLEKYNKNKKRCLN